ncbi:uncharacterized protein M421DRAFT_3606 [Didymella exigua CBS 183.55]|uniref:Uncharacterized protein n=1 Tax=Didymella exigua CBS 183.55 TaxID=1150837 RepID=A0A6A5RQE6_9PLEO|nr:uncharacterized protein M421DRAFT_3606 [Didymella exigua CBS 183.55]KAF1930565.1 hypothetical protein M421DRAFT_3606 [Didymella exigua CBS 183.55]
MVQDPNFWRRFSVAVHNDEAAMLAAEAGKGNKEDKHAYVVSLSSPIDSPSSASTPTSQCHLSPAFPPAAFTGPATAPVHVIQSEKEKRKEARRSKASSGTRSVYFEAAGWKTPEMIALHRLPSFPHSSHTPTPSLPSTPHSAHFALAADSPPSKRASRRASRFRFALSSHPPSLPPTPKSTAFPASTYSSPASQHTSRFAKHANGSRLSLGISLSGRPKSAFRFWTTITAGTVDAETNAGIRDSWLEGQQRKARQRAWMCWAFWGVFLVLVAGAIVTVLVLRGKGMI